MSEPDTTWHLDPVASTPEEFGEAPDAGAPPPFEAAPAATSDGASMIEERRAPAATREHIRVARKPVFVPWPAPEVRDEPLKLAMPAPIVTPLQYRSYAQYRSPRLALFAASTALVLALGAMATALVGLRHQPPQVQAMTAAALPPVSPAATAPIAVPPPSTPAPVKRAAAVPEDSTKTSVPEVAIASPALAPATTTDKAAATPAVSPAAASPASATASASTPTVTAAAPADAAPAAQATDAKSGDAKPAKPADTKTTAAQDPQTYSPTVVTSTETVVPQVLPLPRRKVAPAKLPVAAIDPTPVPAAEKAPPVLVSPAVTALQRAVDHGDALAAYRLGIRYALGQDVTQDDAHAAALFRTAAQGGVAAAQYNLGILYADGRGVSRDATQSVSWLRRAAAQGSADAAFNLGVASTDGTGTEKSATDAAGWFLLAARQGSVNAQFNLAMLYENGNGVTASPIEAFAWYAAAAAHGDNGAAQRRDALAAKLSPDDLKKAQARAQTIAQIDKAPSTGAVAAAQP